MFQIGQKVVVPIGMGFPHVGNYEISGIIIQRAIHRGRQVVTVKDANGEFWKGFATEVRILSS